MGNGEWEHRVLTAKFQYVLSSWLGLSHGWESAGIRDDVFCRKLIPSPDRQD